MCASVFNFLFIYFFNFGDLVSCSLGCHFRGDLNVILIYGGFFVCLFLFGKVSQQQTGLEALNWAFQQALAGKTGRKTCSAMRSGFAE